jgi:hypothetical protein
MASNARYTLATIPAELRQNIYKHILFHEMDVRLILDRPPSVSNSDKKEERKLQIDDNPHFGPCAECIAIAKTTGALMQTCKLVHEEMYPLLYANSDFCLIELPVAHRFVDNTAARFRPIITELSLGHTCDPGKGAKTERAQLQYIVENLPELRQPRWRGLNSTADSYEKGTEWKPYELRKIKTLLDKSKHLAKVFFDPKGHRCCIDLRFTDKAGIVQGDVIFERCSSVLALLLNILGVLVGSLVLSFIEFRQFEMEDTPYLYPQSFVIFPAGLEPIFGATLSAVATVRVFN